MVLFEVVSAVPGLVLQAVCLVLINASRFEDVLEEYPPVLRLRHRPVECIEPLTVLGRYKRRVDMHQRNAQFHADLVFNCLRCGFVVLIQEEVRLELFFCDFVVEKQFPAFAARRDLAVFLLGDAPLGAWRTADE